MNYFPFQRVFWAILLITALVLGFGLWRLFAFPDSAWPLDKGDRVMIVPGETLTQPFVANRDGLRRIEILFGKFSLMENDVLTLELRDSSCSTVLAQKQLKKQDFDSEYTHSFLVSRIGNSKDQTYCLAFTFISDRKVTKEKAPRLFVDKSVQQPVYTLTSGDEILTGTQAIAIRPGYTNDSFFTNADELFDRISQYKPAFLKSWFLITFVTLGLALTFLATALLIKEDKEEL